MGIQESGPGSRRPWPRRAWSGGSASTTFRCGAGPQLALTQPSRSTSAKGGTTHPFLTLKFLTGGTYNLEDGLFYAQSGRPKYYYSTDTVQSERYKGLRAEDLVDIAVYHGLHFHGPTRARRGVPPDRRAVRVRQARRRAIGDNLQQARFLYKQALQVLDEETGSRRGRSVAPR
jgi:hypothetical protein